MKKRASALVCALALLLSACGKTAVSEKPEVETKKPLPHRHEAFEYSVEDCDAVKHITLRSNAEIALLTRYRNVETVDATACTDYAALCEVQRAMPDCAIEWYVPVDGLTVSSFETELDLAGHELTDVEALQTALSGLPRLRRVKLLDSGLSDMDCRRLADALPDVKFVWMLHFGKYSLPTDALCFSTLRAEYEKDRLTEEDVAPLFRYCTDLRALDLGHNAIADIAGIERLKELRFLILADNKVLSNVAPLAELPKLEYLEMFMCYGITDFSFLKQMPGMIAMNMCYVSTVPDLEFVDTMPKLEYLWIMACHVHTVDYEACVAAHPDIRIVDDTGSRSSTDGGWRETDINAAVRYAFKNWQYVTSLESWDNMTVELPETSEG